MIIIMGANQGRRSWLLRTFDTDGEVNFAGIRGSTNPAFKLVLNAYCPYFRLRHQYHFW
jgi:hypothetical protein